MSFDEPVTRPSASPLLPRYDLREPLWYVSATAFPSGTRVTAHDSTDPANAAVEDVVESKRPEGAISRRACVVATDQPQLIQAELRTRPELRLYRVQVPSRASTSGRFDRQLLNAPAVPIDAAEDYWARWCNVKRPIRTEVLVTELVIIEELPAAFTAAVRGLTRDLTPSELMDGALSF